MIPKVFHSDFRQNLAIRTYASIGRHKTGKIGIRTFNDAIFDPAVGVFADGRLVPETFVVAQNGERLSGLTAQGAFPKPSATRKFEGQRACYLGIVNSCWGHCLLDSTRFLWPVTLGMLPADMPLVYSLARDPGKPDPEDFLPNFRELLLCAGVDPSRLVRITGPTSFESLLIPDECFRCDESSLAIHTFTTEARKMFERIAERAAPDAAEPTRTVYLSRSHWKQNAHEFGERRIEEVVQRFSKCEVVSPERLTFCEMVRILRETKKLFTTEGSLAHNAVFLPLGAEIVLLMKAGNYNLYQPMVDEMRELKVTYVEINSSDRFYRDDQKWMGPFFLHVTRSLADYLHCEPEWPRWLRFKYLFNVFCVRLYRKFRI